MEDFTGIKDLLTHLAWGGDLKASRPWSPDFGGGLIGAHLPDGLRRTGTPIPNGLATRAARNVHGQGKALNKMILFALTRIVLKPAPKKAPTAARSPITRG